MQKVTLVSASLLLVMVSGVCFAQSPSPEKELTTLRAEWAHALHEKQLEPSLALYTEDATFLTPDGKRFTGKDAIRGLYQGIFAEFTSDLTFESKQVGFSGVLAYDSGTYRETLTTVASGAQQQASGSYLMVLRLEPDGKWRIVQQMWAGAEPAHPAAPTTRH
jgi:uncharacterized protein (TIGR02246 family)